MADEMIRHIDIDGKPRPLAASNLKKSGRIVIGIEGVHTMDDADVLFGTSEEDALQNSAMLQNAMDDEGVSEVLLLSGDYWLRGDNLWSNVIREGKRLCGTGTTTKIHGSDRYGEGDAGAIFKLEFNSELSNLEISEIGWGGGGYSPIVGVEYSGTAKSFSGTRVNNISTPEDGSITGIPVIENIDYISNCRFIGGLEPYPAISCKSCSVVENNTFWWGSESAIFIEYSSKNVKIINNHFEANYDGGEAVIENRGEGTIVANNTGYYIIEGNEPSSTVGATTVPESKFKQLNEIGSTVELVFENGFWCSQDSRRLVEGATYLLRVPYTSETATAIINIGYGDISYSTPFGFGGETAIFSYESGALYVTNNELGNGMMDSEQSVEAYRIL